MKITVLAATFLFSRLSTFSAEIPVSQEETLPSAFVAPTHADVLKMIVTHLDQTKRAGNTVQRNSWSMIFKGHHEGIELKANLDLNTNFDTHSIFIPQDKQEIPLDTFDQLASDAMLFYANQIFDVSAGVCISYTLSEKTKDLSINYALREVDGFKPILSLEPIIPSNSQSRFSHLGRALREVIHFKTRQTDVFSHEFYFSSPSDVIIRFDPYFENSSVMRLTELAALSLKSNISLNPQQYQIHNFECWGLLTSDCQFKSYGSNVVRIKF